MRSSITTRSGNLPSWGGDPPPPPPSPPKSFIFTSPRIDHSNNENLRSTSDMIFAANSCIPSPRKRSRTKMEDAFRTLSLTNEDRDFSSPSRKRHEVRSNSYQFSSHSVEPTPAVLEINNSISRLQPSCKLNNAKMSIIDCETESNHDDDSSEATATVDNTSRDNDAVKQVMYSLVFGDERRSVPTNSSCMSSSTSGLVLEPLTHVDAKIEGMIRKSRLQALVMTGKPKHTFRNKRVVTCDNGFESSNNAKSTLSNSSIETMSVQDDFHVNISCTYFERNRNESFNSNIVDSQIANSMTDCEMLSQGSNDNANLTHGALRRRSKSFDDLGEM